MKGKLDELAGVTMSFNLIFQGLLYALKCLEKN